MQSETIIIGNNLRQIREEKNFTQDQIGEVLSVSFQQVQKYEAGKNRISADKLYILKNLYAVPYDYFFKGLYSDDKYDHQPLDPVLLNLQNCGDENLKAKLYKILNILLT